MGPGSQKITQLDHDNPLEALQRQMLMALSGASLEWKVPRDPSGLQVNSHQEVIPSPNAPFSSAICRLPQGKSPGVGHSGYLERKLPIQAVWPQMGKGS